MKLTKKTIEQKVREINSASSEDEQDRIIIEFINAGVRELDYERVSELRDFLFERCYKTKTMTVKKDAALNKEYRGILSRMKTITIEGFMEVSDGKYRPTYRVESYDGDYFIFCRTGFDYGKHMVINPLNNLTAKFSRDVGSLVEKYGRRIPNATAIAEFLERIKKAG